MSYRKDSVPIRITPNNAEKIDFIANVFDASIQGISNYLLENILDSVIDNVKEFEKSMSEDVKESIRQTIKKHYSIEIKKKRP